MCRFCPAKPDPGRTAWATGKGKTADVPGWNLSRCQNAHVIRRALGAGVLAMLLTAGVAMAAAPAGPRLAIVKLSANRFELLTVNQGGSRPVRLAGGGRRARPLLQIFSRLSWSPDGRTVAFSGIVGFQKGDDHEPLRRLFTVNADGSRLRPIRGPNLSL